MVSSLTYVLAVMIMVIVVQCAWFSSLKSTLECAQKALASVGKRSSSSRQKFGINMAIRVYDVIWDITKRGEANTKSEFDVVLLDTPDANAIYQDIIDNTIGQIIVDKTVMDVVSAEMSKEREVRIVAKYKKGGMVYGVDLHAPSSGHPHQYLETDLSKQRPMIAQIIGLPKFAKERQDRRKKKKLT